MDVSSIPLCSRAINLHLRRVSILSPDRPPAVAGIGATLIGHRLILYERLPLGGEKNSGWENRLLRAPDGSRMTAPSYDSQATVGPYPGDDAREYPRIYPRHHYLWRSDNTHGAGNVPSWNDDDHWHSDRWARKTEWIITYALVNEVSLDFSNVMKKKKKSFWYYKKIE